MKKSQENSPRGQEKQQEEEEEMKNEYEYKYKSEEYQFKVTLTLKENDQELELFLKDEDPCSIPQFSYKSSFTYDQIKKANKFFLMTETMKEAYREINAKLATNHYEIELRENDPEDFEVIYLIIDTLSPIAGKIEFKIQREQKDQDKIIKDLCQGVNQIYKSVKQLEKDTKLLSEEIENSQKENLKIDEEIEKLLKQDQLEELKLGEDDEEEDKEDKNCSDKSKEPWYLENDTYHKCNESCKGNIVCLNLILSLVQMMSIVFTI